MKNTEEFLSKQKLTLGMRNLINQALKIHEIEIRREYEGKKQKTKKPKNNGKDSDQGNPSPDIQ